MYIGCQRVAATSSVKTVSDLTVPAKATAVEIQSDTQDVRYTMDNSTAPVTGGPGMVFKAAMEPKLFSIGDLARIKFIRDAGSDGALNFHYIAGRDI